MTVYTELPVGHGYNVGMHACTVSDKEHSEIIRIYVEEGLGYAAIAERLHRSSRTPHEHIGAHNKSVERSGFCASCKRAKGQYFTAIANRGNEKKQEEKQ